MQKRKHKRNQKIKSNFKRKHQYNLDTIIESEIKKNLKILDLTGAGDLFAAGFLHGYINKLSTKECLEKGTEMSSRVIQQIGARL